MKRPLKYIIVLILPLLSLLGCSFLTIGLNSTKYIIPKGYQGLVLIVFDQPDGIEPEKEGKNITYRIPSNGILKIKKQVPDVVKSNKFYYSELQDNKEILTEIPYRFPESDPNYKPINDAPLINNLPISVFDLGVETVPLRVSDYKGENGQIVCLSFLIGDYNKVDSLGSVATKSIFQTFVGTK